MLVCAVTECRKGPQCECRKGPTYVGRALHGPGLEAFVSRLKDKI